MRLILIHGFGCGPADWSAQLEDLNGVANPVAVDLTGEVGRRSAESPIGRMAERVNDVRRASGPIPTVLVGHSLGCRVALEAAGRLPDALEGLVLIEGSLRAVGDADHAVRTYLSRSVEDNKALLMRDFAGMFGDAIPTWFRDAALRRAARMNADEAVRLMAAMTVWDAARAPEALRSVRAPILVLQSTYKAPGGERRPIAADEMSPWLHLVAAQAAGRARVTRLHGLGHFPQVEAPALVNQAIASFLAGLKSGGSGS